MDLTINNIYDRIIDIIDDVTILMETNVDVDYLYDDLSSVEFCLQLAKTDCEVVLDDIATAEAEDNSNGKAIDKECG